jgi:hypothetical protein
MKQRTDLHGVAGYSRFTLACLIFLLFAGGISCSHNETSNVDPAKKAEPMGEGSVTKPSITAINDNPSDYEGMRLSLTGVFKGWKGKCKGSPPVSRSDWMIAEGTACLYVNGPLPKGLQAMSPHDERVTITGTVKIGHSGMAYIKAAP